MALIRTAAAAGTGEEAGEMRVSRVVPAAAAAMVLAGCGSGAAPRTAPPGADIDLSGQTIEVAGVGANDEQTPFERVLHRFEEEPGATVPYVSGGDELPTVLSPRLAGGDPP